MRKTIIWRLLGAVAILVVVIQLVPYGHDHTNPAVRKEPAWTSPATRELANRACYDCHSNQPFWPWYSQIAPVSWLIQNDVDRGRRRLNFSEWDQPQRGARAGSVDRRIQRGSMPPWYYIVLHSQASLSDAEKQALVQGLDATVTQDRPPVAARAEQHEGKDRMGDEG